MGSAWLTSVLAIYHRGVAGAIANFQKVTLTMHVGEKIFVYGTLKSGQHANHLLRDYAEFINDDRIEGSLYNLGAFPGFKAEGSNMVSGEVYEISDEKLPRMLDEYECYPTLYDRVKIRTEKGYYCWVYVLKRKIKQDQLIEEGVW